MTRTIYIVIFLVGFCALIVSDFTAHYPWYFSLTLGYALGSLGAGAVLGARRR